MITMPMDLNTGIWTEQALRVLKERYLYRKENGTQETPEEMLWRVAITLAQVDARYGADQEAIHSRAVQYYDMMVCKNFCPNSPTLMNAGIEGGLQWAACFVIPVTDSIEGIYTAVKNSAIIHQSGGGLGISLSDLRPAGYPVKKSSGVASGPVSFLRLFDLSTEVIKQGGRRRGANMGVLCCHHPDLDMFINCKSGGGIVNFNLSVGITGDFMEAYYKNTEYDIVDHTGKIVGQCSAQETMNKIAAAAWKTGDPGLVFLDRANNSSSNPCPSMYQIKTPNACGEVFLPDYGVCTLGSINLGNFVQGTKIDWYGISYTSRLAVRLLDAIVDANPYPLHEIKEMSLAERRIGLGVMGWADMLAKLRIRYDCEEALCLAEKVMAHIQHAGKEESRTLAEERGPFPWFDRSIYCHDKPIRNGTITIIAPTGSISVLCGCSSGIEPFYALAFRHNNQLGREMVMVNPIFEEAMQSNDVANRHAVMEYVKEHGHPPKGWVLFENAFRTAHEISPEWHIKMQAAFQKFTCNSVSKTVNVANNATKEDVLKCYLLAYDLGCKGVTVYRDGCKEKQVLNIGTGIKSDKPLKPAEFVYNVPPVTTIEQRPRVLDGKTYRTHTSMGSCFVTVNNHPNDGPAEVFCKVGKAGSDISAMTEAMGRLISFALRMPSPMPNKDRVEGLAEQLLGIGGSRHEGVGPSRVRSIPDALGQALIEHVGARKMIDEVPPTALKHVSPNIDLCPDCGSGTLVLEEGCQHCIRCGYSMC